MAKQFKEGGRNPKNALVVDLLNLAFRWKHQKRSDYRFDLEQTIQSLATSYRCGQIIITADWGSSAYRKALLPEYKDNRKELREKQTEQEAMFFEEFIAEYLETITLLESKLPVLRFKGVEADDIAAYIVKEKERLDLEQIWLISSDRDWDLLIQEDVNRFSYVTRKETTLENWYEHYSVSPEQYISYKCLTGDKEDNVPGIPAIGPVRAAALLEEYGNAFELYASLPIDGKYKYIQNLNASGDLILLNYELMDLLTYCEDAIGTENIEEILCKLENTQKG